MRVLVTRTRVHLWDTAYVSRCGHSGGTFLEVTELPDLPRCASCFRDKNRRAKMFPHKIREQIQEWDTSDAERAHQAEDALYVEVLKAIAEGHVDPQGLARAALESQQLGFSRWCA